MESVQVPTAGPFPPFESVSLIAPLTQKARGIAALSQYQFQARVPEFRIYSAKAVHPKQLVGYFARPCPMRPRHGFVDSRVVRTIEDGESLIRQTLTADPEAEIVTMPHVAAEFSGIWTPGLLVIGRGTDGATSGSSALSVPAIGDLAMSRALKEAAGVEGTPYLELLWRSRDSPALQVQLRDGPPLPQSVDFIPADTIVEKVILAEGDLLQWEASMQSAQQGTVVHHPDGSLASHYAIHAVLNRIPVMVSRQPTIGEHLEAQASDAQPRPCDLDALRAGFYVASIIDIEYEKAAYIMLAGCHHIAVWKGRHDHLLGLALGFAYRLTVTAALGEMRHAPDRADHPSRDSVYEGCWDRTHRLRGRHRFQRALHAFLELSWPKSYGGRRWLHFSQLGALIHNHVLTGNTDEALMALNRLVHCAHNTGWGFNKFINDRVLDETAWNPVTAMVRCAPDLYRAATVVTRGKAKLLKRFLYCREPLTLVEEISALEFPDWERPPERRVYRRQHLEREPRIPRDRSFHERQRRVDTRGDIPF
jgi:hypothetical protein